MSGKIPLLVLAGPTASGKSSLALRLAPLLKTEIISADSAQVYRGLDIGTAKPTAGEQEAVRHHLIDVVDPDQRYSVARYQRDAQSLIGSLWAGGRLPFLVGGTGLYLRAVTDNYAFGKRGGDSILREQLAAEADRIGPEALHERLERLDPAAAERIHPRDRRRIIRALEVFTLEGAPISDQVVRTRKEEPPYRLLIFGLSLSRPQLYRAIEERVETMLDRGFLAEVQGLLRKGYPRSCPALQILGYRQLAACTAGEISLKEAVEEIKTETRRLAKRQLTWFRRDQRMIWLDRSKETGPERLVEIISRRVKEILA